MTCHSSNQPNPPLSTDLRPNRQPPSEPKIHKKVAWRNEPRNLLKTNVAFLKTATITQETQAHPDRHAIESTQSPSRRCRFPGPGLGYPSAPPSAMGVNAAAAALTPAGRTDRNLSWSLDQ